MQTIFMNTKRSKTNKPHKLILNLPQRLNFRQTCCSSKLVHLFHVEKYKKTVSEQQIKNNSSNVEL